MIFLYFLKQIKFSRTFQESCLNSSTFPACANPVQITDTSIMAVLYIVFLLQKNHNCIPLFESLQDYFPALP